MVLGQSHENFKNIVDISAISYLRGKSILNGSDKDS